MLPEAMNRDKPKQNKALSYMFLLQVFGICCRGENGVWQLKVENMKLKIILG
jgi:hypothetical protein